MNKKGFTMIELIGVISILGLIMTIVATNGFGVLETSKKRIKEDAVKEIAEGAKVFLTDVEYCDEEINKDVLDKFYTLGLISAKKCTKLQEEVVGNVLTDGDCLEFELSTLKDLNYVSSDAVQDIINEDNDFSLRTCLNNKVKSVALICDECSDENFKTVPADITLIQE